MAGISVRHTTKDSVTEAVIAVPDTTPPFEMSALLSQMAETILGPMIDVTFDDDDGDSWKLRAGENK